MAELFRKAPRNLVKICVNLSKSYHVLIVVIVAPINLCDCWLLGYQLEFVSSWLGRQRQSCRCFLSFWNSFHLWLPNPGCTMLFFSKNYKTLVAFKTPGSWVFTCKLRPKLRLPGPPFATPTRKEGVSATLQSSCVSCVQGKKAFMS